MKIKLLLSKIFTLTLLSLALNFNNGALSSHDDIKNDSDTSNATKSALQSYADSYGELQHIPIELIKHIFSFVPSKDLLTSEAVNHQWYELIESIKLGQQSFGFNEDFCSGVVNNNSKTRFDFCLERGCIFEEDEYNWECAYFLYNTHNKKKLLESIKSSILYNLCDRLCLSEDYRFNRINVMKELQKSSISALTCFDLYSPDVKDFVEDLTSLKSLKHLKLQSINLSNLDHDDIDKFITLDLTSLEMTCYKLPILCLEKILEHVIDKGQLKSLIIANSEFYDSELLIKIVNQLNIIKHNNGINYINFFGLTKDRKIIDQFRNGNISEDKVRSQDNCRIYFGY